ncbi:glycosyltransferase family 9 protein, partial [Candidatus Woesearchaeota archaeon]|nr:glycosyltransferase family 9 protein [Candidatus Woesearchaeota archaeon]
MEKSKKRPLKILLFKIGAIGDVLMTTPFVRELRKKYRGAEIHYWVGRKSADILKNNPYVDKVIAIDEDIFFKKKLFRYLQLARKIKRHNYNLAFVLDKHWIFQLLVKLAGIKKIVGFIRDKPSRFLLEKGIVYD